MSFPPSEYWVKVTGAEGLERSAGAVAAPTFDITLRVNNEGRSPQVCGRVVRVDVAYEGVPLAHGEVPDFCVPPGVVGSVPVVAAGEGLGLPDELYDRSHGEPTPAERGRVAGGARVDAGDNRQPRCTVAAVVHGSAGGATKGAVSLPSFRATG
ncbi:hypothetical protein BAE44_0015324 [Dichanthelium oligosanthes]|uniref:Late embryogenesis abundant protein LEA-2 subgroup domain-containing protein n=1 Tax=Dichanthelium oligosanthes TaxID=888268 RepID=A0A1E5VF26_9POAL|nr:hypothetical protein BAE44_0015324 [Dichanthelium oligosanthes]